MCLLLEDYGISGLFHRYLIFSSFQVFFPLFSWILMLECYRFWASQVAQWAENLPADRGDAGSIPGSGKFHGGGHGGIPLQHSCLENSMDRGAWRATVHGVTELATTEVTEHACTSQGSDLVLPSFLSSPLLDQPHGFILFLKIFIHLVVKHLSCGTWNLNFFVACELLVAAYGL